MKDQTLTTVQVQGVAQWQQYANSVLLPRTVAECAGEELSAEITAIVIDGIRAYLFTGSAHHSTRGERLIGFGNDPFFAVVYQLRGTSLVAQHGESTVLHPGEFTVYDATSPYDREFHAGTTLVILVPQQLISLPPRAFQRMSALSINAAAGAGAICAKLLGGVAENMAALEGRAGRAILQTAIDLVAACIADTLEIGPSRRAQNKLVTMMQVREYIMSNLGDPDLGPQRIAEAHYISVRSLHHLFKDQGTTVCTWIRERRLEMAWRDLMDVHNTEPIREIGQRWGFIEATHFSNAFKSAYGISPRQCRQVAQRACAPEDTQTAIVR